jgi:hypothetical protein
MTTLQIGTLAPPLEARPGASRAKLRTATADGEARRARDCAALRNEVWAKRPLKPPSTRLAERTITAGAFEAARHRRRIASDPVLAYNK